jgi:hypothetical protein
MAARTTVTLTASVPARLADALGLAATDRQAGDVLSLPHADALALVVADVARFGSAAEDADDTPTVAAPAVTLPATDTDREKYVPGRLSQTTLRTNFGPRTPRPGALLAVAVGDSRTMGDSTTPFAYQYNASPPGGPLANGQLPDLTYPAVGPFEYRHGPRSWFEHACLASGGRLRALFNAGQGTDTTTGMLRRFPIDVVAKKPDIVFIGDTHNDNTGEAITRANILAMIDLAQAAGITVCLYSALPSDTAGTAAKLRRNNAWLKMTAQARRLLFVDPWSAVVDPADGTYLTAMTNDGTHASYLGARAAGLKVVADLAGFLSGTAEWLPTDNAQDTNLLTQGLNLAGGGFYATSTGTQAATYETDATKYLGRALVSTITATGVSRISQDVTMSARGIAVGDRLKWVGLARVRNAAAGNLRWALEMYAPGNGAYITRPVENTLTGMDMPEWFYYETEFVVPAAATVLRVGANALSGTGEISLAQQGLYNLTKLGVATS